MRFIGSFPAADFRVAPPHPEIAFVGRSNVGKSTLLNAITGRRAIAHTSKTPGKTRMCTVYAVDDRLYLVDLPGYGYARRSQTERRGFVALIEAYLSGRPALAGAVWLLDIRRDPSADDRRIGELLAATGRPVVAAVTKADKLLRANRRDRLAAIRSALGLAEEQCVMTSAKTKEGVEELWEAIEQLVGRTVRRTDGPNDGIE